MVHIKKKGGVFLFLFLETDFILFSQLFLLVGG